MNENKTPELQEEEAVFCMLEDENGDEHKFEVIAECEHQGAKYYAMIPALDSDMNDEFCEYVILKEIVDGEDVSLVSIDDNEEEFNAVADIFDNLFDEEVDYDAPKK